MSATAMALCLLPLAVSAAPIRLAPIPATAQRRQVIEATGPRVDYALSLAGVLDEDNTTTRSHTDIQTAFQPNVALTLENVGDVPVVNPRLVVNGQGDWHDLPSLLADLTRGAGTVQDQVYLIWQRFRASRYHELPLFANSEPHDPVKLLNVYGLALCDDDGNAGASLFHHLGLLGSVNRALDGHVQCEAMVDGKLQFIDIDQDCFYLDRENERPVSGDELARDHDLVRRELNYGPEVGRFSDSDSVAALFGADDRKHESTTHGHRLDLTLRPGEALLLRFDNLGKVCAESDQWYRIPLLFGNSKLRYTPRLDAMAVARDAASSAGIVPSSRADAELCGDGPEAALVYDLSAPYPACGGAIRADFVGAAADAGFQLDVSVAKDAWQTVWKAAGAGLHRAEVSIDQALQVRRAPAKYGYQVRVGLAGAASHLAALTIETDVMAWPLSLPRLRLGGNQVVYTDQTEVAHHLRITHEWQECDSVTPPAPPAADYPAAGAVVKDSIVPFRWAAVEGATRYHLQVSLRPDFAWPYRPSFDVVIPQTQWAVPYTGIFSPDRTYHWRLRARDARGVWSAWSVPRTFTWQGPRVPVGVRVELDGHRAVLHWQANPRGERPVRYEVYGSDEKGFSVHQEPYQSYCRGKVPGNFLAETTATSLPVAGPEATAENQNQVYYRVVAIDANGTSSGCSDFAELPHPFIVGEPPRTALVGQEYTYLVRSLRSLGDVQHRGNQQPNNKFWDTEINHFELASGPDWLALDEHTGELHGTPTAPGTATVTVAVTNQLKGRAEQTFDLTVKP